MIRLAFVVMAVLSVCASAFAQNNAPPPPKEFFRLDFLVKELDGGKLLNTRSFQTMAPTDDAQSSIRSGDKIAVPAGTGGTTYLDVGVSLDVRSIRRSNNGLELYIVADISNAEPGGANVIREVKWSSAVSIPIRKPTVVFMSDDPTSKHQLQLEITATPVHD